MFIAHTIFEFQQSFNMCWPDAYRQGQDQKGLQTQGRQDPAGVLGTAQQGGLGGLQEQHYAEGPADKSQRENRPAGRAGDAKDQGRLVCDVQQVRAKGLSLSWQISAIKLR